MAKKTSVTIRGVPQAKDNLMRLINSSIKQKEFLDTIGSEASNQIRNRTRGRLEEYKQDPLSDSSVDRRKALIGAGNFADSRSTRPKQSNLTLSGQLLDAIHYRINQATSVVSIILLGGRQPYRGVRGKPLENKTNREIKDDLEAIDRKFFFISEKLKSLLESRIAQSLRRKLSQFNKIKRSLSLK